MSDEATTPNGEVDVTWYEREMVAALQRVANARSQLTTLEEQASPPDPLAAADRADVERVVEVHARIQELEPKTRSRIGGGKARAEVAELESTLDLVLARIGLPLEEVLAGADGPPPPTAEVDPVVLEFARRELADAEALLAELLALDVPPPEPADDVADDGPAGDVVPMKLRPPAAS